MIPSGEKKCIATVKVRISPVFWGWLFQFAGEMRIISPVNLQEEYRQRGEKLL
jgi:hypothetical protein